MLKLDKRSFKQFFYDQIKRKNPFYYAFFRKSLVEPKLIRVINFYLNIILVIAINTLFYTDEVIEDLNQFLIKNRNLVNSL